MDTAVAAPARGRTLGAPLSLDPGALSAWLLPAALVTYLGVRSGGYDPVISDQVGIAMWWIVFLLVALRVVPLRMTVSARVGLGLLAAFAAWTTLSLTWTESSERTMGDVTLMLLYVALAALAFLIRGPKTARLILSGLATAIVAIAVIALLSRLHFQWFSLPQVASALPYNARKLSYPLGYWNALAAVMAIGMPLLLYVATAGRTLVGRAVAGAGVPLLALCAFLTVSRGGALELGIGVVLFLALAPDRLPKLAVTAVCALGSGLLVDAANQRGAVRDGARSALAAHQGRQLIVIAIVVSVAVALLVYAAALVERHAERPRVLVVSRGRMSAVASIAAVVALVVFIGAGGPHFLNREWTQFKTPGSPASANNGTVVNRLQNVSGNNRDQYWKAAERAAKLHPWTGTGAATFIYWWARDGTKSGGFVEDTHSLYLQALAELGYPGLLLISLFIGWILLCGVFRCVRVRDPARRLAIAAATASATVFACSAAVEWIWLIPVLPAALFICAAVIFSSDDSPRVGGGLLSRLGRNVWLGHGARGVGALAALVAIVVIALPLAATVAVRQSQSQARAGNLQGALTDAREAVRLQPYAASPRIQEASVLELGGDLPDALTQAIAATQRETTNSNNWLVLSRLEARNGHAHAAIADYVRARSLNPNSPLFAQ